MASDRAPLESFPVDLAFAKSLKKIEVRALFMQLLSIHREPAK
jgi:hypothetical protein